MDTSIKYKFTQKTETFVDKIFAGAFGASATIIFNQAFEN
jgi:hypothetical protein